MLHMWWDCRWRVMSMRWLPRVVMRSIPILLVLLRRLLRAILQTRRVGNHIEECRGIRTGHWQRTRKVSSHERRIARGEATACTGSETRSESRRVECTSLLVLVVVLRGRFPGVTMAIL